MGHDCQPIAAEEAMGTDRGAGENGGSSCWIQRKKKLNIALFFKFHFHCAKNMRANLAIF